MKTIDYIEMIHKMNDWSYYKIAQKLEITQSGMSKYRHGQRTFDDETCIKVGELLQKNPEIVLADIHAERAKVRKTKEVWQSIAKALRATTAAAVITTLINLYPVKSMVYAAYITHQYILCKIALIAQLLPFNHKCLNYIAMISINYSYDLSNLKRPSVISGHF